MKHFCEMNHDELMEQYKLASADFERCKQMELHLDMSRGKPSKAQLEPVSYTHLRAHET